MTMFSCWLSIAQLAVVVLKTQTQKVFDTPVMMSDTAPVSVGGTATFNCTYCPGCRNAPPQKVTWYPLRQKDAALVLFQGIGTSCTARSSIYQFTFEHTCDAVKRQYILRIIGVTEHDLHINYGWCCSFGPDLKTCAKITKVITSTTISATTNDRTEAISEAITEVITKVTESTVSMATSRGTIPETSSHLWIEMLIVFLLSANI